MAGEQNSKGVDPDVFDAAMQAFCRSLTYATNELYEKLRPEDGGSREVGVTLSMLADALTIFLLGMDIQIKSEASYTPGGEPAHDGRFNAIEAFMSAFLPNLVKLGAGFMFDPDMDPEAHATMMEAFNAVTSVPPDGRKH